MNILTRHLGNGIHGNVLSIFHYIARGFLSLFFFLFLFFLHSGSGSGSDSGFDFGFELLQQLRNCVR